MTEHTREKTVRSSSTSRPRLLTFFSILLVFALLVASSPPTSSAGGGEMENGKLNLSISVRFDADDALIGEDGELHQLFQRASELLYDATDGQHQLGTITVFNNSGGGRNVDIHILDENGTSNATVRTRILGIIVSGLGGLGRINLYLEDLRDESPWVDDQGNPLADGAHVIVHELGHYAYGLYDEYQTDGGALASCIDMTENPDSGQASLMENFWPGHEVDDTRIGISEFCVADNHDPDGDTEHESERGESTWETMHNFFSDLLIPGPRPQDNPPTEPADPIEWKVIEPDTRFIIVIDRSGSMSGEPIRNAKIGASAFTFLADDGEKLGVASFASSASLDFSLTEMNIWTRATAILVINTLNASGLTAMGDGLRTALNEIVDEGPRASRQAIILLSDGFHNTGEHPNTVIPDLQDAEIPVFTIGLGPNVDEALMKKIASDTGGNFFRTRTTFGLIVDFIRLALETRDGGTVESAPSQISQGELQELPALIDSTTDRAVFTIVWESASNDLDLTLRRPDGTIVDPAVADVDPDIEFIQLDQTEFYKITAPMAGEWMLRTEAVVAPNPVAYEARALVESTVVDFTAATNKDHYAYPEPVIVQGLPIFYVPVIGAQVNGIAIRPDGSTVPITLFDDGDELHGDSMAGDGIYSSLFSSFNEDGTYAFELTVVNEGGVQRPGEGLFNFPDTGSLDPPDPLPTEPFTRKAQVSVIVSGVPETVVVPIDIKPEGEPNSINCNNERAIIPVTILSTDAFDATTVDHTTVTFEGATEIRVNRKTGEPLRDEEDVDGDGDLDLVFLFFLRDTNLTCASTEGILTGATFDGQLIMGTDTVRMVDRGGGKP